MKLKKLRKIRKGFTLIELLIYIALVSVILTSSIYFAWDILYGQVKSDVQREVNQNLRLAGERISYEIRNASDISVISNNSLCLLTYDRGLMVFTISSGRLNLGWGGTCLAPTNSYPLTSNLVTASALNFTNFSSGLSKNVRFSLTVSSTGARQEWQKTETYSGSVEIRKI